MRPVLTALIGLMALVAGLAQQQESLAFVHCMRVWAVMAGAGGDSTIQYVELRMSQATQPVTNNTQLHFFNASAGMETTFTIPTNVDNSQLGASILIGTQDFDDAWPAGTPDFIMPVNVIAPAGKVAFGPSGGPNCVGEANYYDSVAYGGANYTGTTNYGNKNSEQLPVSGNQALKLQALTQDQTDNEDEYTLQTNPQPCKNAPLGSPVCGPIVLDNTPTGTSVSVSLGSGATVTFASVTASGNTSLTTSSTGPTPPSGFSLGTPVVYYEIATTATFSGVTVCIDYNGQFFTEDGLKLFHHNGAAWTDVTTSLDTVTNKVCGQVASFSPFLVALPDVDGDGVSNLTDNCVNAANGPAQTATPGIGNQLNTDKALRAALWRLGPGLPLLPEDPQGDACDDDDDNDQFPDAEEQRLYGSPGFAAQQRVPCVSPGNPDPWPPDVAPFAAPDRAIDTTDAVVQLGFVGYGPLSIGYPGMRYDLDNDGLGALDTTEVVILLGLVGYSCQAP